jgi:low temperature requirement protein LtrA
LPAVGWVVLGLSYAVGGPLLGIGLYLVIVGSFPGWWRDWLLRPVVHVTHTVARLQGVAAISLGASVVAIGLSTFMSDVAGGALILVAIVSYLIGAALFIYSTLLSRREAA